MGATPGVAMLRAACAASDDAGAFRIGSARMRWPVAAGLTPHEALRRERAPAAELGLLDPEIDEETLIAAMTERPELVNRPIVCTPKGVRLCRPAERVLELLEQPSGKA